MKFADSVIEAISRYLVNLGFTKCSICQAERLNIHKQPLIVHLGGADPEKTPDANILFFVGVECDLCGHVHLFNASRFHGDDEPTLERT